MEGRGGGGWRKGGGGRAGGERRGKERENADRKQNMYRWKKENNRGW